MQGAIVSKPTPSEDNFEMKATKAMGAMEEGDAVFGNVAEVESGLVLHVINFLDFGFDLFDLYFLLRQPHT